MFFFEKEKHKRSAQKSFQTFIVSERFQKRKIFEKRCRFLLSFEISKTRKIIETKKIDSQKTPYQIL
jgi:hypothetical protein